MKLFPRVDRLLLIVGLLLIGVYVVAGVHKHLLSHLAIAGVEAEPAGAEAPQSGDPLPASKPDFSLWSPGRIKGFEESLAQHFAPALGIMRIPKAKIEAPVLEGTDDITLNRGVGHIAGTAGLGENGNVGIAGHRDGFFRGLKDIQVGDTIEVETRTQTLTYVIDGVTIVDPSDVSVLQPRGHASLTLVTCYPFYFVGSAPSRYIVQASLAGQQPKDQHAAKQ